MDSTQVEYYNRGDDCEDEGLDIAKMNMITRQQRSMQLSAKSKAITKANARASKKKAHKGDVLLKRAMSSDDQVREYRKYLDS